MGQSKHPFRQSSNLLFRKTDNNKAVITAQLSGGFFQIWQTLSFVPIRCNRQDDFSTTNVIPLTQIRTNRPELGQIHTVIDDTAWIMPQMRTHKMPLQPLTGNHKSHVARLGQNLLFHSMIASAAIQAFTNRVLCVNDGAAAIVICSGEAVEKYGLKPMAKLVSWGQGGVDPKIMGVGPVPACRQAMKKADLKIEDIDLVEANEAFAAQSIAVARELGFDMAKVNVNGGAISIGHPVGASGARIIVTLLHEMAKRPDAKKGLATLCIGGGMGVATIFEKC